MSAPILTAPVFVDSLPAEQRATLAPRKSELKEACEKFVAQLMKNRDKWARAAQNVVSTSSIYETFRELGCEVRVVRLMDPETKQPKVERRNDSKGQPKDYPVCDIYVMLPPGEVKNRSGRKPWVPPAKLLESHREEFSKRETTPERRAEIEAHVAAILERNPKLVGHAGWQRKSA